MNNSKGTFYPQDSIYIASNGSRITLENNPFTGQYEWHPELGDGEFLTQLPSDVNHAETLAQAIEEIESV